MRRRTLAKAFVAAPLVPVLAGCAGAEAASLQQTGSGSLVFDEDAFTTETKSVSTSAGDKEVIYRLYRGVTYVANPVDTKYQSLNVRVPVTIDDADVDTTNAPILMDIAVGGYMSSSVVDSEPGNGVPSGMPSASAPPGGGGQMVSNGDLALAAGYVVVSPGARGRDNVTSDGTYYGKAPAAIVDLKAAVRYVRYNKGRIPGNTDWIITTGSSAGGALSTLLGASADQRLYDSYLTEIGAAKVSDAVFASAGYCPIADLEHADMAYEWMFGTSTLASGEQVDQAVSAQLKSAFTGYQAALKIEGKNGFGRITADNYDEYLLRTYLEPAATKYVEALSSSERDSYLAQNSWITWSDGKATLSFEDFLSHVGRRKNVPAFDDFDLSQAEPILFGNETTNARHFTLFSLRYTAGDSSAELDSDLPQKISMMNPMYFIKRKNPARAKHWWIRVGTSDTDTSLTVVGNLAASLENLRDDVDALMYWDGGHGANEDAEDFITWIARVTGYTAPGAGS